MIPPEAHVLQELQEANSALEGRDPQAVLEWAISRYHPDIALACSFGGISGMALLDMSIRIQPKVHVFYLDTDFLFPETYRLVAEVSRRYGITPVAYRSRWSPEAQAREFGEGLWSRDPDLCCQLRKIEPNFRALEGKRAWIAGLRRDQSITRNGVQAVDWDYQFGLVKVNPLVMWTEAQVLGYVQVNNVPYNPLYDKGYTSIGCDYCTRPVKPGDDLRAGRWQGFEKIECGLHLWDHRNRDVKLGARADG